MKKFVTTLQVFLALLLLAAAGWFLWTLGGRAVDWFGKLDTPTRTGLLTVFGLLMVPLITFGTQFYLGNRQSREQAIRDKRTEFYVQVIELFMDIMGVTKTGATIDGDADYQMRMLKQYTQMLTYASPKFIRAWNRYIEVARGVMSDAVQRKFEDEEERSDFNTLLSMAALEDVLTALRKDLGHHSKKSQHGNLISVFVTDLSHDRIQKIQNAKKFLDANLPK